MSRTLSLSAGLILTMAASIAQARGHGHGHAPHGHGHHHHATSRGGPSMNIQWEYGSGYRGYRGYSGFRDFNRIPYYGYGYAYEPYRHGSFRAPDLLNEPSFRAQHKFDSQFPGRYSRRPRLQLKTAVPVHRHP